MQTLPFIRYGSQVHRDEAIQVRLVSARLGGPVQVKMTKDERLFLERAATKHSTSGKLSSFLRELGVSCASHLHDRVLGEVAPEYTVRRTIELAAEESNMLVGEFLRVVALEAIGFGHLTECCLAARAALEAGKLQVTGSDYFPVESEPAPVKRGPGRPRKYPRPGEF